jgi:cytochrome c peroxidase
MTNLCSGRFIPFDTLASSVSSPRRNSLRTACIRLGLFGVSFGLSFASCAGKVPPDPREELVKKGEELFFNETFSGNGRTCGTCHPEENNFTLDPAFIATLPDDDPLFVAERSPDLRENFEKPRLMREFGLILENLDGFEDVENRFVLRGIPHTLALRTTVASSQGPRTGWSGDGAPGDGSLRSFATGAVIQHFTKTLARVPDVDFRLPTSDELDALEAFQLSLGRQDDLKLPLALKGEVPRRGQEIFLDDSLGKCNLCHVNAGATVDLGAGNLGNVNFDTGVENLPDQPPDLTGETVPPDDGFGIPGDGTFNPPSLVEAADSPPFFHNNAVQTIEGAVAFYDGDAFNESPAGEMLAQMDPEGAGIEIDATQIEAVAAFLRVINALESVRQAAEMLEASIQARPSERALRLLRRARAETEDARSVLAARDLHRAAVVELDAALRLVDAEISRPKRNGNPTRQAIEALRRARAELVEP